MRLVFVAHRFPYPPNKGDKIRSFFELGGLAACGHEIHLLAFADDPLDLNKDHEAALLRICRSVSIVPLNTLWATLKSLGYLFRRAPLSIGYFGSRRMRRSVKETLARLDPDAVVVYSSTMAQYIPQAFVSRTVVDLVDADSEKWRDYARMSPAPLSWLYTLEFRRLRAYERAIIARFGQTVVSTDREAALLEPGETAPGASRLHALRNGVDWQRFQSEAFDDPREALPERERHFLPDPALPLVVFTGAMNYRANVDGLRYFVDEVFPLVRARSANAQLLIVGAKPTAAVRRLGSHAGVTVTGAVEDVRPYLAAATVCVAPLRIARGIQNKVIEAMAMGRAVVATPAAVAGLDVTAGEHVLVGRTTEELAQAVLRVMFDPHLRESLGRSARRFVRHEHDWQPMLQRFADLVESVAV